MLGNLVEENVLGATKSKPSKATNGGDPTSCRNQYYFSTCVGGNDLDDDLRKLRESILSVAMDRANTPSLFVPYASTTIDTQ